jgi:hypothetical protein
MDARLKIILQGVRDTIDNVLEWEDGLNALKPLTPEPTPALTPEPTPAAALDPRMAAPATVALDSGMAAPATAALDSGMAAPATAALDSEGLPWDARIHSSGRTRYKGGSNAGQWKAQRKVAPLLIAQVKTELRTAYPAPATVIPATVAPATVIPATVIPATVAPATVIPPITNSMAWSELMARIATAGCTPEAAQEACTNYGIENIGKLQDSPAMIPLIASALGV